MNYFEYVEPKTVKEACEFLKQHGEGKILAGGASLVVLQKNNFIRPSHLVNLKTIPGLDNIEQDEEGLRIGALNRHRDILSSPVVQKFCPVLVEAASKIATPPIRNMGTIGGNLCHGDPAADFPPSLIALGAKVKLVSDEGERIVPIETFFVDYYETVLSPAEILTEIRIPPLSPRSSGLILHWIRSQILLRLWLWPRSSVWTTMERAPMQEWGWEGLLLLPSRLERLKSYWLAKD